MKKVLSLIIVLCMMFSFVPMVQAANVTFLPKDTLLEVCLDGEWDFKYYENASYVPKDVTQIVFDDEIQVPGAMELQGYGFPSYYFEEAGAWGMPEDDGVRSAGVYKTVFDIPEVSLKGYRYLNFENFRDDITVYLDGEKIGESKNGAVGATFEIDMAVGDHVLICVVKRDNSGINKSDNFALSGIMGSVYATQELADDAIKHDVKVENNTLTVDSEDVVLRGVRYTPTHPETGDVLTLEQIDKDLALIKEYGFNTVWVSCAPDYFYEACEILGIYIIDEANVNLSYADRDMNTAKKRVEEMIARHKGYRSIILWSVGSGTGNAQQLIDTIKKLDKRPVAQEVTFAPDFKVFGNTGGMADWVNSLGENNVGGFVDEFSDKELYFTRNVYAFDTIDSVTGETVSIDGEIKNHMGTQMLGKAGYVRNVEDMDKFTVLSYITNADKNRVIFETADKSIRLETVDYRIRLSVNGQRIEADGGEGKVAAVYSDGEMQLFTSRSFKGNMECDARLTNSYLVGEGDGNVAIQYVKIYNDALSIDELIEGADEKLVSSVEFKDITIKEDKSYKFLAYGGDFGDITNSYYKCLTGIFSSTREPHPEAEAFKALLENNKAEEVKADYAVITPLNIHPVSGSEINEGYLFENGRLRVVIDREGKIVSIQDNGNELLTSPMYPTFVRENTLNEYEMGVVSEEYLSGVNTELKNGALYVTYRNFTTGGEATVKYEMYNGGFMQVSMQAEFSENAEKPGFIGFRGVGKFDKAKWLGYKESSYPDRRGVSVGTFEMAISDMSDNYAVPQESGNKEVGYMELTGEKGRLVFKSASEYDTLYCQVLDYSPQAMENADHDEDIEKDGNTYFRVGGFIKGLSGNNKYSLSENVYGYSFFIGNVNSAIPLVNNVQEIFVNGEELTAFAPYVDTYVYKTNEIAEVKDATTDSKKAVVGDYTIYFAPDTEYMSDMTPSEITAQISKDKDFNGTGFTIRGNDYWAPVAGYDKGICLKGGSVSYDVSKFTNHTFNAVIGKNDFDWRKMGGGFDRNMFNASCDVTISLDGVVVKEVKGISMRGGSEEVNIDVSDAKVMTITVKGNGVAPMYEDAVIANAAFVPNGPIVVNFEKKDSMVSLTVLNTDEDVVDVVLTATENNIVTTEATSIGKGLYATIEIPAGNSAKVSAVITGLGTVTLD